MLRVVFKISVKDGFGQTSCASFLFTFSKDSSYSILSLPPFLIFVSDFDCKFGLVLEAVLSTIMRKGRLEARLLSRRWKIGFQFPPWPDFCNLG